MEIEPAFEPGTDRLDLQGMLLALKPGPALESQQPLISDLLAQQSFQALAIDHPIELNERRLHRHMGVVMPMVMPMVMPIKVIVMIVVVMAVVSVVVVIVTVVIVEADRIAGTRGRPRPIQAEQQGGRHLAALHRQNRHTRPDTAGEILPQAFDARRGEAIGAADQHEIGRLQLVLEEILDVAEVIEAWIRQPLGLER